MVEGEMKWKKEVNQNGQVVSVLAEEIGKGSDTDRVGDQPSFATEEPMPGVRLSPEAADREVQDIYAKHKAEKDVTNPYAPQNGGDVDHGA